MDGPLSEDGSEADFLTVKIDFTALSFLAKDKTRHDKWS